MKFKSIYLDNNATTPLDPRVFEKMKPYFDLSFGNPASQLHAMGWEAKTAIDQAREKVASLIQAQPHEVAFTAGATESNNWALKGLVEYLTEENPKQPLHVLTSNIEHASVREPLLAMQNKGLIEVDFLPVDKKGYLHLDLLKKMKKPHTRIISLIWVHNEIGTIQNISELAHWAASENIYFHTDATQAAGKIPVNVQEIPISLLSFSGHKLYGPKGVGALYIRNSNPKVILRPLLHGGGQEMAGRSGTLNVPGIVGLGEACDLAKAEMSLDYERIQRLMKNFWYELKTKFPGLVLNGPEISKRTAFNLNITLPGIQSFQLLPLIPDLCVSGGSACRSGQLLGNPILLAIGHNPSDPSISLRISSGRNTTAADMRQALESLSKALISLDFANMKEGSQDLTTVLK